jgi:homoserine kinase type II
MIDQATLLACLADRWGLTGVRVASHPGGMNSATWLVTRGGERWIAKAVDPSMRRSFAGGLAVAARVEAAGIPAGAPVPTRDGQVVADAGRVPLALLSWVDGHGLSGSTPTEQRLIGSTLARVHATLRAAPITPTSRFHWVDVDAEHLGIRRWVRGAVACAVADLERYGLPRLSQGTLHTDPAPEAFRWAPSRDTCGLIDWSAAMTGPLLYDVASAVMFCGGPLTARRLVDAYLEHGTLSRAEVDDGLAVMLRFRWAVQADYFARRIAAGDLTGIAEASQNEVGLHDARVHLGALDT